MKKDKEQSSFVNIGSSSLLIIFLILCLAVFAVLSLSSAKSDYSLSERLAEHKTQYYEAASQAEIILDQIDSVLEETAQTSSLSDLSSSAVFTSSSYVEDVTEVLDGALINGISISYALQDEELVISYQVPAGEKQSLDVALLVTDYFTSESYYKIQQWQINAAGTWEGDNTLNLMPIGKE